MPDLITARMLSEGWIPGAPNTETKAFDREEVAMSCCERCGSDGLTYRPFTRYDDETPRSRFFGVCPRPRCRHATEF